MTNYSRVVPFAERAKKMTDQLYGIRKTAEAKMATKAVYLTHGSRKKGTTKRPKRIKRPSPPPMRTLFDDINEDYNSE